VSNTQATLSVPLQSKGCCGDDCCGGSSASAQQGLSSWPGCIAGALTDEEYRSGLAEAGFSEIDLEVTWRYSLADVPASLTGWAAGMDDAQRAQVVAQFASTFVRAVKPRNG
jgi:hypothetical protein